MTYDELVAAALAMPDVEESGDARGAHVHRAGGWMFSLKGDGETVVFKLDGPTHDRLRKAEPGVLFKTPHYEDYPALLAKLDDLTPDLARQLLEASWADAPNKVRGKRGPRI